jgi:hypothetical protein
MSISNASPLPETLTPATGGQVDPADLARKTQANFDAFYAPGASGYGQTWGYDSPGTNQVRIYIADAFGSGAPAGKFFFALVGGVA